jgi:hypothetical protein
VGASASGRRPCLVSIQSPVPFRRGEGNLALGALISPFLGELSALCSHEPLCVSNVESRFLTMLERAVAK